MGSLVPFQNLNLQPDSTNYTSSPIQNPRIIPKIEPKREPLDEYTRADIQTTPFFSNLVHISTSVLVQLSPIPPGYEEIIVYSEFNRMQRCRDVEVVEHQDSRVEVVEDPDSRASVPDNDDTQVSEIVIARKIHTKITGIG
ncbi:hypothetical protein RND71_022520 [Anisodus tanguticus]|uniref:Uncharacterized protein n=1 Tax=Anisodus tanguticus TaxID=243964 RepID=A0AAE1RSM9_9SOLA|nr:hypothetical protein RND71_022520 [Anisodus tanguticus]